MSQNAAGVRDELVEAAFAAKAAGFERLCLTCLKGFSESPHCPRCAPVPTVPRPAPSASPVETPPSCKCDFAADLCEVHEWVDGRQRLRASAGEPRSDAADAERLARILDGIHSHMFQVEDSRNLILLAARDAALSDQHGKAVALTGDDFWWMVDRLRGQQRPAAPAAPPGVAAYAEMLAAAVGEPSEPVSDEEVTAALAMQDRVVEEIWGPDASLDGALVQDAERETMRRVLQDFIGRRLSSGQAPRDLFTGDSNG